MRSFVFWIAVLTMAAGSFTAARAQEQKEEMAPAQTAAAPEQEQKQDAAPAPTADVPAQEQKQDAAPAQATTAPDKPQPAQNGAAEQKKSDASGQSATKPASGKQKQAQHKGPQLDPDNPHSTKLMAEAKELAKTLNGDQSNAVHGIWGGFDIMHIIRSTEADVSRAVESCGKNNPDMKQTMDARFDKWKSGVDPVLAKNEKDMDATIKSKIAGDPKKIRDYFDLFAKYQDYEKSKIDKRPASTAQACQALLGSMDRTQIALSDALQKIKWPVASAAGDTPAPDKSPQPEPAAGKNP